MNEEEPYWRWLRRRLSEAVRGMDARKWTAGAKGAMLLVLTLFLGWFLPLCIDKYLVEVPLIPGLAIILSTYFFGLSYAFYLLNKPRKAKEDQ